MSQDAGAMGFDSIQRSLKTGEYHGLRSLSRGEWSVFIHELFNRQVHSSTDINVDRLIGMGVALARADKIGLDTMALDWLQQEVSIRRLDIVGSFLSGYWLSPYRSRPVDPTNIDALIKAYEGIAALPEYVQYSFIQAISAAMRTGTAEVTRVRLRGMLEDALRQAFRPPLDRLVLVTVENALNDGK